MSWHDIPGWIQGAVIGASAWVLYLLVRIFEYYYQRKLVEDLGTKIQPYLYFSLPEAHSFILLLVLFSAVGTLLGLLYQLFRTARRA